MLCRILLTAVIFLVPLTATASRLDQTGATWKVYRDPINGFRLALPSDWNVVPNSDTQVNLVIQRLEAKHKVALAGIYQNIVRTTDVSHFVFEAFHFTPSALIQPTFTLSVTRSSRILASPKGLASIASSESKQLIRNEGLDLVEAKVVKLPAGNAAFIEGTEVVASTRSLLEIYVIGHEARLYDLTFRTSAGTRDEEPIFLKVAHRIVLG